MPHSVLDHTADTGIEATARTLHGLVAELSHGMFELMAEIDPDRAEQWITVELAAPTSEDLVVDTLSELLYRSEVDDLHFCDLRAEPGPDDISVKISAGGVPTGSVELTGPPIKAVTMHDLVAEPRDGGWYGRVYLDV